MTRALNYLRSKVPGAELVITQLAQAPQIKLWLLNGDYPQDQLDAEVVGSLMDSPPYWSFCWASGQVLAAEILQDSKVVWGKTVIDFGAGSGVVAIAAAKAGASRIIACDTDPYARDICLANAQLNQVSIEVADSLEDAFRIADQNDCVRLITFADVFYDRSNLPLLQTLQERADEILLADSRLKGQSLPSLRLVKTVGSCTLPDLDESKDFNRVNIYTNQAAGQTPFRG